MGLLGVCPWSEKLQKGTPKNITKGGWNYLPNKSVWPGFPGRCLSVCLYITRVAEATESRRRQVKEFGAQMSGCPRAGKKSLPNGKKSPTYALTVEHPHPDFPFPQLWGHFSALHPSPPPTYLFPFLDFIFHGESSLLLLPPYWPPLPLSPPHTAPLFFFLPGRKLHQPWSSCPSCVIVSRGGGGWTQPRDPSAEQWEPSSSN